jgi:hypothetical protein
MPTRAARVPVVLGLVSVAIAVAGPPGPEGCVELAGAALGAASEVAASGTTACVINGVLGIDVLDLTDPLAPAHLATIGTDFARLNLAFDGELLLHSGSRPQIALVDLSEPSAPRPLGGFDLAGGLACRDMVLGEDLVFAVDTLSWFYTVDLADPAAPSELGRCELVGEQLYSLAVEDGLACIMALGFDSRAWRLYTVSVADPAAPAVLGFAEFPHQYAGRDIALRAGRAVVPTFDSGTVFLDVSDPASPEITGAHGGFALDVHLDGETAVLSGPGDDADRPGRIELLDLAAPGGPAPLGSASLPWPSSGITTLGDHALIADRGRGLTVVDAADPMNPAPVSFSTVIPSRPSFVVEGGTLIEGQGLLRLFDIADPEDIRHERTLEIVEGGVGFLERAGDLGVGCAARIGEPNRLASIDLSDPADPALLGTAWVQEIEGGAPSALAVDSGIAAVSSRELAAFGGALELFDLTDPASPRPAARLAAETGTALTEVFEVVGRTVYFRDAGGRLVILDAADIDAPIEAGAFAEIAAVGDVTVADGTAWRDLLLRRPPARGPRAAGVQRVAFVTGSRAAPPRGSGQRQEVADGPVQRRPAPGACRSATDLLPSSRPPW